MLNLAQGENIKRCLVAPREARRRRSGSRCHLWPREAKEQHQVWGYIMALDIIGTSGPLGWHVAIIMDGSGRWAIARGLPRSAGHRAGMGAVRRVVQAAPGLGIGALTLHAFSSDNWQRPAPEVAALMRIFEDYLRADLEAWVGRGIRVSVLGRRDRLEPGLVAAVEAAERATQGGRALDLCLAIDYSARDAILRAARRVNGTPELSREAFSQLLAEATGTAPPGREVDLLIRTGGELRLSDFMLWECAYAELVFTKRLWPDFDAADLAAALSEFCSRERRFGRVPEAVVS
jgi:undecaprenyl diphosphate synthase